MFMSDCDTFRWSQGTPNKRGLPRRETGRVKSKVRVQRTGSSSGRGVAHPCPFQGRVRGVIVDDNLGGPVKPSDTRDRKTLSNPHRLLSVSTGSRRRRVDSVSHGVAGSESVGGAGGRVLVRPTCRLGVIRARHLGLTN